MRTIELLQSLTATELGSLRQQVAGSKRKSLQNLFTELKRYLKNEKIPANPVLFKAAFGKPYIKTKDYLLRNELRLLNKLIYEFLIIKKFREQIKTDTSLFNSWLARAYFDRKMKLFAADIDGFIELAASAFKMEEATAMCSLRGRWAGGYDIKMRLETGLDHIKQWKELEKKKFVYGLREAEFAEAFFLQPNNKQAYDDFGWNADRSDPGLTQLDVREVAQNDWYASYLMLKKQYYQSTGQHRLNYARQLYDLTGKKEVRAVLGPEAHIGVTENLAYCLGAIGEMEESAKYAGAAIELGRKYKKNISPNYLCNYIITLYVLHRFEEAIKNFNLYKRQIEGTPNYIPARVISAYCYLFLEEPDKALALLPPLTGLLTGETIESRYVYLIAFMLRRQYDLALNEARNLKRQLLADEQGHEHDLEVLDFIYNWIRIITKPKKDSEQQKSRFKKRIEDNMDIYGPKASQSPALAWLFHQIGIQN
jgi:hypothetical protein